jgi:uncharacterized membrane protein
VIRPAPALASAAVLAQVAHPLLDGGGLHAATTVAVLLFCAASLASAWQAGGPRTALAVLAAAGGVGLVSEAVGVATGFPFGEYAYAGTLGPQLLGVPLVVPLAWTMMAWPALVAARRLTGGPAAVAVAAWLLASWDLFLDPQMVAAGHWTWAHPDPGLPGVPGIPLTNYAGWLLVAAGVQAALHRAVPPGSRGDHAAPAILLTWTWLGSTVANLAFFGRPAVALYGFAAMGVVVLPYLVSLRRRADRPQPVPA